MLQLRGFALRAGLVVVCGLAGASSLAAQAQEQEREDRWRSDLGLSVNSSGGNERLTVITSDVSVARIGTTLYELTLRGRVRYGRSEGEEVARNTRASVNMDLWPRERWTPFLFSQAEQDPFRRLQLRMNSGAGLKRTFWRDGWNEVSLSGAVLHSYVNLVMPDLDEPDVTHTARWSWRGRIRRQVREGTRVQQVIFFMPAWRDMADYQIEANTTARVTVSERLALTSSLLYERDSRPATGVLPDDWSISLGISLATAW